MSALTKRLFQIKSLSWWTVVILFSFILILAVNHGAPLPLSWDTMGYHVYLSEYFVDGDLLVEDLSYYQYIQNTYDNTGSLYQFVPVESGGYITKYTSGWAILNAPFMLLAHWFAGWFNYAQDGFSAPYQTACLIGSLFYTLLGLVLIRKVLLHFVSDQISALAIFILVLGTNYLHMNYSCIGLVHVYLFTLYALLLLLTIRFYKQKSVILAISIGATLGLMALIRPTEMLAGIIPITYGITNLETFKNRLIEVFNTKHYYVSIITFICVYGVQLIYWKLTTGSFFFYSYTNPAEGLDLNKPHIIEILFSFRKGWFIYTPVMLLIIFGFVRLYNKNKEIFWPLFLFTTINLYVISCWTVWWYTGSFSNRAIEHSYPIYLIVIVFAINELTKTKKLIVGSFLIITVGLNLFQTWQVQHGIVHLSNMTREYYFSVFGQTEPVSNEQKKLLLIERGQSSFNNQKDYNLIQTVRPQFELPIQVSQENPYTPLIKIPYNELTHSDHLWIIAKAKVEKLDTNSVNLEIPLAVHLCVNMQYENQNYAWTNVTLSKFNNTESLLTKEYLTPDLRTNADPICVGIWHQSGPEVIISELYFEVYEPK